MDAFLFPHVHASEREIKTLLSFFDTLTIFQPWHMQDDFSMSSEQGLRVVHPPEHLRPIAGFPSLLSEYKNWMRQCKDRGYASALSAIQFAKTKDCTWDIRKAIRGLDERTGRSQNSATQWHLLLHLARETETRLREAGEVLAILKEKGSPLRDAMVEEEAQGPLNDLSDFELEREIDEESIEMILDAWQGLFSRSLDRNAGLVTLSRPVFQSISALWSEYRSSVQTEEEMLRFSWPDLSHLNTSELRMRKAVLEGDQRMRGFKEALQRMMSHPTGSFKDLSALVKDLDADPQWKNGKMLSFSVHFLRIEPEFRMGKRNLGVLSGKSLFLLEGPDRG